MILTHGANSLDETNVIFLHGVRYENRFYEIDSNNVGSTFVDAVRLPEGYEKLGRVYNSSVSSVNPMIITEFQIPIEFGTAYLGAYIASFNNDYPYIFSNRYVDESYRYVRVIGSYKTSNKYLVNINTSGERSLVIDKTASCALRDDNKYRVSLISDDTWYNGRQQVGNYGQDRILVLLSERGTITFRFLFFVDRNRQVTFTAIPCKHSNDYGLYDVVAGKFYTHADLTGD